MLFVDLKGQIVRTHLKFLEVPFIKSRHIYICLDLQKHGYRNPFIYPRTEPCSGALFFFIVTFYLFNRYRIGHINLDRLCWVSRWLLTYYRPPPPPKKMFFIPSHYSLCLSVWNHRTYRPFALRGHVTSFLWKWKLYDFAFEKQLVGHILNKIMVIWFFKPEPFS